MVLGPTSAAAHSVAGSAADVTYTLTVTTNGTGSGRVTSSPAGINCPSTCSYDFSAGTQVTLTATPATGSSFGGWFREGFPQPCTGTGTCTLTIDQAQSIRATFTEITESLGVLNAYEPGASGTITISGPGTQLTVAPGTRRQAFFNYGATVTITTAAAVGSVFAQWYGSCSGNGSCKLVMTKSLSMEGMFAKAAELKVQLTGKGAGTVTEPSDGISCPGTCSGLAAVGFPVTLTATAAAGSYFAGWPTSSGCDDSQSTCTFDMPSSDDVEVALFRLDHCLVPNVKRLELANATSRLAAYSCRAGKITHSVFVAREERGRDLGEAEDRLSAEAGREGEPRRQSRQAPSEALAGAEGLEPPTYGFGDRRSTN